MAMTAVEKSKTRSDLAQLAGRGPFSLIAMLAGVLVGYATFALLLGGAVAILRGNGSQLDLSENWGDLSNRGGLLLGGLLFLAYLLGGYIAGRMAWRRGAAARRPGGPGQRPRRRRRGSAPRSPDPA